MAIKVGWENKIQTIIRYEFVGNWDWVEFERAVEQSFTMTESVDHVVDVIMNFQKSKGTPDDALTYFKLKLSALPWNRGMIVVVGEDPVLNTSLNMLTRIHKQLSKPLARTKSNEEARTLFIRARAQRSSAANQIFTTA